MKGNVVGEDGSTIGVTVQDSDSADHQIEMHLDGEIYSHHQDGYSDDPSERTQTENERVKQARRYAKYYVFRERGHPTLAPADVPEWLVVVAAAIAQESPEDFQRQFGQYHQQLRSAVEPTVDPIVDVPEDDVAGLRVYLLNVHLGIDISDQLDDEAHIAFRTLLERETDPDALVEAVTDHVDGLQLGPDTLSVTGVSDVGVLYQGATKEIVQEGADPHPGPADARLELSPTGASDGEYLSIETFQLLVVHHLLCQARDCYLGMGLEPPEALRVLGLGRYRQTVRNEHLALYEPVHGTTEPIEGYSLPEIGTHLEPNSE